jgi:hypothetical protein
VTFPPGSVPPEVLEQAARAGRRIRRLLILQLAWFVVFIIGGIDLVVTLLRNGGSELTHCGAAIVGSSSCGGHAHHSYSVPVGLLLLGVAGFIANGYLMAWLGRRYLGRASRFLAGPGTWGASTTVTFGAPIHDDEHPPPSPPSF